MNYSKQRVRRAVRIDFRSSHIESEWKNDELGQLLRWSLRPDVTHTEPAGKVKAQIMRQLHEVDARRAQPPVWREWLGLAQQWFNDYVLSSEVMWPTSLHTARTGQFARYQLLTPWLFQGPNFGHALPMI